MSIMQCTMANFEQPDGGVKISSFVEILGLFVRVVRGFGIWKHKSSLFTFKEGF